MIRLEAIHPPYRAPRKCRPVKVDPDLLKQAIYRLGGPRLLAERFGLRQTAIWSWQYRKTVSQHHLTALLAMLKERNANPPEPWYDIPV